jgi:hypothetical protein
MIKILPILLIVFVALTGCEEPPPAAKKIENVQSTAQIATSQNEWAGEKPATAVVGAEPTSTKSFTIKPGQRISFNEDAASAMAKVREMMAASANARNDLSGGSGSGSSTRPYAGSTPPPVVKEMLEMARDDKATTDIINSALSDLPQGDTDTPSGGNQDNLALGTNQSSPQFSVNSNQQLGSTVQNVGIRNPQKIASKEPSSSAPTPTPTPTPEPEPSEAPLIKGAMPRGYLMLYMAHPRARELVELQIQNLIDAKVENVFVGLLTDGTFGRDFSYVKSALTRLHQAERIVTLAVYLSNGATMRYHDKTPINVGFSQTSPLVFRSGIKFDSAIRNKYLNLARDGVDLLSHNATLSPRNKNIAIPMLEDNLDKSSYLAIRELTKSALGNVTAIIMRSHCLGCYSGNDADGAGDPLDEHGSTVFHRVKNGDGFSFDGAQFLYPGEQAYGLPFDAALGLASESERRRAAFFGLWRSLWQGLGQGPLVHPDKRNYIPPTSQELEWDIKLLRAGLE